MVHIFKDNDNIPTDTLIRFCGNLKCLKDNGGQLKDTSESA